MWCSLACFLFYFFQENSPDLCTKVLCFVEVFEHLLQEFSLVYFTVISLFEWFCNQQTGGARGWWARVKMFARGGSRARARV
jgi:hypothetical protein